MRKMVFGRKLSRSRKSRRALFRGLVSSIVVEGKIITTKAKAKAVLPLVDKVITLAKKKTLSSKREILSDLANDKKTVDRLFDVIVPSFETRTSGFLRIVPLPSRKGDSAGMVRLEWSQAVKELPEAKAKVKKTKEIKAKTVVKKASPKKVTKPSKVVKASKKSK